MKILALEHELPGAAPEAIHPYARAEAAQAWQLYRQGIIRELHFRADRAQAVLMLECDDVESAHQALATLPLVANGLISFELIPLAPYPGFERLFANRSHYNTMTTTTTIETLRLYLHPMRADDFAALFEIFADPRVMASFGGELLTPTQMQQWLQRNLDHQAQFGYGLFSVNEKASGRLIGDCGLEQMQIDGQTVVELGYDLRSDVWNQGFATEAASAVRDYAFQILRLPRLISLIRVGNAASQRVAEKLGMQREAEFERYGARYWRYAIKAAPVTQNSTSHEDAP